MKTFIQEQIAAFKSLFCVGRMDVYGTYYLDSGRYLVVKDPITDEVIRKHLEGGIPFGVFMLKGDVTSLAVVDFDKPDTNPVAAFVKRAGEMGLPVYVERSKGKGYHCWGFFENDVLSKSVRTFFRSVLDSIGAPTVEVFPKQDSVKPGEFGNFVNCPLFGKHVQEGRTAFVDSNFQPYANQWEYLRTVKRIPRSVLDPLLIRFNEQAEGSQNQNRPQETSESSATGSRTFGLLPCATRMLNEGVKSMQRCAAFRLGVALKKTGLPFEATVAVLLAWAKKNKPDDGKGVITSEEIEYQVSSSYRKPYAGCGCNDPAVIPFCDPNCRLKVGKQLREEHRRQPDDRR